jgi:uncharacterized integral membrane protein (TIGR00697 family)
MKYYFTLSIIFISCLLTANVISIKIISVSFFSLPAGIVIFPISYIIGDIITEVYGLKKAKSTIFFGLVAQVILILFIQIAIILPAADFWPYQSEFKLILYSVPRVIVGSLCGYFVGENLNAIFFHRIKVKTKGKYFVKRAILSSVVGQSADSVIFVLIAYLGTIPMTAILKIIISGIIIKLTYEIIVLPITIKSIRIIREKEGI